MMYEPVLTKCLTTTTKIRPQYPSFTQINYTRTMEEQKGAEMDAEVGNNNIPKEKPPMKPPRWFQRSLTWRNSFSGMLNCLI